MTRIILRWRVAEWGRCEAWPFCASGPECPGSFAPGTGLQPAHYPLLRDLGISPADVPDLLDLRAGPAEEVADGFVPGDDDAVGLAGGFDEVGVFEDGAAVSDQSAGGGEAFPKCFVGGVAQEENAPSSHHPSKPPPGELPPVLAPLAQALFTEDDPVMVLDSVEDRPSGIGELIGLLS